jgi:hypothetical protein
MKSTLILGALLLMVACGPKSTSETTTTDSTDVVKQDTVSAQPVDTVQAQEPAPVPPVVTEVKTEKKDPSVKTLRCKFQKFEPGDCLHYIFDCGDLGAAVTTSLPKDQADMWNNLIAFSDDHGDAPSSNPQYVGKTFEIVHNMIPGDVCQDQGGTSKQQVPNLLSFKLVK